MTDTHRDVAERLEGLPEGIEPLTGPFTTHHPGRPHAIVMWHGSPWLVWQHPDGQWVTEAKVETTDLLSRQDGEREVDAWITERGFRNFTQHGDPYVTAYRKRDRGDVPVYFGAPPAPEAPEGAEWPASNMAEAAWSIIANVGRGNWSDQPDDWREAAERWRDTYIASLPHHGGPPMTMGEAEGEHPLDTQPCPYCGNDPLDEPEPIEKLLKDAWFAAVRWQLTQQSPQSIITAFDRWLATREPDASGEGP